MNSGWPLALCLCGLALLASACGDDRFIMIGTAKAPSTSGFVEMKDERSDGATIRVHLEFLQPVQRVDPAAKFYVVWLDGHAGSTGSAEQTAALRPVKAGVLKYDADQRTGEVTVDSPFRRFLVKVTAETSENPSAPSANEVASQEVSVDD